MNKSKSYRAVNPVTSPVDNLDLLDHDDALKALHQWFFNYTLHCMEDGVSDEMHDSICALYLEFKYLLEKKKLARSRKPA